jgi:2-(1,2-epoxy-1,2-dihydrophenyl)acetyl-CoA isomerase
MDTVLFEVQDGVATLTLNEGDKLNPLTEPMRLGWLAGLQRVRDDTSIRALIVTAAGRGFCVGADLLDFQRRAGEVQADDSLGRYVGRMMDDTGNPIAQGMRTLPVPVVCAVNGAAAGGGFGLALAGDIVIAARSAYFYLPFVPALGIVPDMGAVWSATRAVGRARALGLTLTGHKLSAAQAAEWGLIWACVDDGLLQSEARQLAVQLAALPAHAIEEARALFAAAEHNSFAQQLKLERDRQELLIDGDSFAEGLRAFAARRKPAFRGR